MIIIVKQDREEKQLKNLIDWVKKQGLEVDVSNGSHSTVLGLIGDTSKIDIDLVRSLDIVESVKRIQEPFKLANRKFHPEDTIVDVSGVKIGGDNFAVIAGPCSVETEKQIVEIAQSVKQSGAKLLRGGAFKPRTSPYSFQGLRETVWNFCLKRKKKRDFPLLPKL